MVRRHGAWQQLNACVHHGLASGGLEHLPSLCEVVERCSSTCAVVVVLLLLVCGAATLTLRCLYDCVCMSVSASLSVMESCALRGSCPASHR